MKPLENVDVGQLSLVPGKERGRGIQDFRPREREGRATTNGENPECVIGTTEET